MLIGFSFSAQEFHGLYLLRSCINYRPEKDCHKNEKTNAKSLTSFTWIYAKSWTLQSRISFCLLWNFQALKTKWHKKFAKKVKTFFLPKCRRQVIHFQCWSCWPGRELIKMFENCSSKLVCLILLRSSRLTRKPRESFVIRKIVNIGNKVRRPWNWESD